MSESADRNLDQTASSTSREKCSIRGCSIGEYTDDKGKSARQQVRAAIKANVEFLHRRYGYQFSGKCLGVRLHKRWLSLFTALCTEVDQLLGPDKRGFHWTYVRVAYGFMHCSFDIEAMADPYEEMKQLDKIRNLITGYEYVTSERRVQDKSLIVIQKPNVKSKRLW